MATRVAAGTAPSVEPKNNARTVLREHPVEVFLFNSTGPITFVWLVVRLWLGWQWVTAGWEKLQSPEWMVGVKLAGFWRSALADYGKPNSDVAYGWYAGFLKNLADSNSQTWFAPLIAWGELLGGIALMLGLLTGLAAFALAFMNFNYMLAGSSGLNPFYFVLAFLLILAWKNAGWWGLDRFILPALSPPGQPGSLFKRKVQVTQARDTTAPTST